MNLAIIPLFLALTTLAYSANNQQTQTTQTNATGSNPTQANTNKQYESERTSKLEQGGIFTKQDSIVTTSTCSFKCREVAAGYKATIVGIDSPSGTTRCEVFDSAGKSTGINANQVNTKCRDDANKKYQGKLSASSAQYTYNQGTFDGQKMTFSKFLGAMATLDGDFIDFQSTKTTGILTLNNPHAVYGSSSVASQIPFMSKLKALFGGNSEINAELLSAADSLNKANLGYYASLFMDMKIVYSYLQNLLFILVGGFFLFKLGSVKIMNYLENDKKGESEYLKQFAIPVVSIAMFFAPIPEASGMNGTVIQNLIRYFTQQSISIADRASSVGTNTYIRYLFNSVGLQSASGEKTLRDNVESYKAQEAQYKSALEFCKTAYPQNLRFNGTTYTRKIGALSIDANDGNVGNEGVNAGNAFDLNQSSDVITGNACADVEHKALSTQKLRKQTEQMVSTIQSNYGGNGKLQSLLNTINTEFNTRQEQLGWANAVIIPSASALINSLSLIQDGNTQMQDTQDNNEKIVEEAKQKSDKTFISWGADKIGWLLSGTPYFLIPGSSGIYDFSKNLASEHSGAFGSILGAYFGNNYGGLWGSILGGVGGFIGGKMTSSIGGDVIMAYFSTQIVVEQILKFLPLIVAMMCGLIVFVGYLVDLAFYFYISPFVVAYAMTERSTGKIVEFLVSGLKLFFKPILLVILIFFAIFLHTLVNDTIIVFAKLQYAVLYTINTDFIVGIVLRVVETLISILAVIASIIIVWKTIMGGVDTIMQHLGLRDTNSTSEWISNKIERYSMHI